MLYLLLILLVIWMMLVYEVSLLFFTVTLGALLVVGSFLLGPVMLFICWASFLVFAVFAHFSNLRQHLLTRAILGLFRRIKPKLSATEQAALEAGDVWWDGELFSGRPDWNKLLTTPAAHLSQEEQDFLDGPVNELCSMLNDWEITHQHHDLPPAVWEFMQQQGFFAMIIPKRYGGLEFSAMAHSQVISRLAAHSLTAAVTVMVPNSLGPAELLLHYGTQEQRDYYLPRLARGEELPCFALTGPTAGSDAASIPDTGIICLGEWQGQTVTGIRLNWEKRYITLGPVATLLGLAFQLKDPDCLISATTEHGITCALIPTDLPGIDMSRRHNPLDIPFMNGPNYGRDVFIPLDMVIGGQQGLGKGWQMLMDCLSAGRGVSLPALSVGAAKLVARDTGAYTAVRRQFGMPIRHFEGIDEVLARIAGLTWMMEAARNLTCAALDQGNKPAVISAIVKQNLTELMRKVVNDAMDIEGGKGICLGPRNHLAAAYQAIPIGITVEGANILTRSMIIFGQGAIRCHPWILKELHAADNPDKRQALQDFDEAFFGHVSLTLHNAAASIFYGLTGGLLIATPATTNRRWYQRATRYATAFALTSDLLLASLGGDLKRKEKLTGRMADILSELYLLSAMLKETHTHPEMNVSDLLEWNARNSQVKMEQQFLAISRNLPWPLGLFLRLMIFPLGSWAVPPRDQLGHRLATAMTTPGPLRDYLTAGLYLSDAEENPAHILSHAFTLAHATEAIEKELRLALKSGSLQKQAAHDLAAAVAAGVITTEQQELLTQARLLRQKVVSVDAF